MVKDRLKELRQEMSKRGIDIYIVPTADFHEQNMSVNTLRLVNS